MTESYSLEWTRQSDRDALLELFHRTFGHHADRAEWAWKYDGPAGHSLQARRDSRVVAHYGGQSRRLLGLGAPLEAVQVSDIMIDPSERGALGRNGLFRQIAEHFSTELCEPRGRHAFVYGFPSPRATRLGELLDIYSRLDSLQQALWKPQARSPECRSMTVDALLPHADRLWGSQRQALASSCLIGVRDRAWLKQRYLSHPSSPYRALALFSRWRRRCLAAAVYREHPDCLELVDLLGAPAHYSRLLSDLRTLCVPLSKAHVMLWATPRVLDLLPSDDADLSPVLQVNIAGPNRLEHATTFSRRCWMTAGDTDYR